jgi:RNA polymerase sigma factor (sigma-70 family)
LGVVYDTYADKVARMVRLGCRLKQTGGSPAGGVFVGPQDFLDVVHDVFLKAFSPSARLGYDGLRSYGPYLSTIARNTMIDWLRRRGAVPEVLTDLADELPDPDGDEGATPPTWGSPETLALVERYLAALPTELRDLHRHRYEQGRSQEETARTLGISRQNLRTLEERLRRGLAQAITDAQGEAPPTRRTKTA